MPHYHVINEAKTYGRVVDAESSFEARKVVAVATREAIGNFFAVRADLMTSNDWKIWNRIKNK